MKKIIILQALIISLLLLILTTPIHAAEPEYQVIPGRQYTLLHDEILTGQNNDTIVRSYTVYSGTTGNIDSYGSFHYGQVYEDYDYFNLPQSFPSLIEAKKWLQDNSPSDLRLRPMTIVSEKVFNQWIQERYLQKNEYWKLAPIGLIPYDIKPAYEIILKPFLPIGLFGLNLPSTVPIIKATINDRLITFSQDKPYISDTGELLLPLRIIASKLGYTVSYSASTGLPIIKLEKGSRIIMLSFWQDFFTINGTKVAFQTKPRLSVNERVLVPLSMLDFMGVTYQWDKEALNLTILHSTNY